MQRSLIYQLKLWKQSSRRKPLLLRGARQVGKTYLLQEFGNKEYSDCAYFNFEADPQLDGFFQGKLNPTVLVENLSIYRGKKISPSDTLIIFDEVQESSKALTSLKYFSESELPYHVAAAGSLLGVQLAKQGSFPVGKVNFLTLHPLSFLEFLSAVGKQELSAYLTRLDSVEAIPEPFHQELLGWLKKYHYVGGMPEAVRQYATDQDLEQVRKIQQEILNAYQLDFSKHVGASDILKIAAVWNLIPGQLAKENKKFIFTAIRKSARGREYETALQWLIHAGLVHPSYFLPDPKLPLSSYAKKSAFKLYLLDVGLLGAMSKLAAPTVLGGDKIFTEFFGALTENFVAQELSALGRELYYWNSPGTAEVDFILNLADRVFPLEVKAGRERGTKSLRVYADKYHPLKLARASLRNLKQDVDFCNFPLYLTSRIPAVLGRDKI